MKEQVRWCGGLTGPETQKKRDHKDSLCLGIGDLGPKRVYN